MTPIHGAEVVEELYKCPLVVVHLAQAPNRGSP